jgi:hypothetical protein
MSRTPSLGVVGLLFRPSLLLLVAALLSCGAAAVASGHHPARHLEQIPLTLDPPALPPAALAGQPLDLQLRPSYGGELALAFALDAGPDGMTIDVETGVLSWTPPASAEGTEVAVNASVTDGRWTARASFTLAVAKTTPIATTLAGNTLTVTATGALHGLRIIFPAGAAPAPALVTLAALQGVSLPSLPRGVRLLTGAFTVTPVTTPEDSWITVSLPAGIVPAGAAPQDLCLYAWGGGDEDGSGSRWIPEWLGLDVLPDGTTTFKVGSLAGLCFVGLAPPLPAGSGAPERTTACSPPDGAETDQVPACEPTALSNGTSDARRWTCGVAGAFPFTVDVVYERAPLWLGGEPNLKLGAGMLSQYLADAAAELDGFGMRWPSRVAVSVEDLGASTRHGDSSLADHYGVLRIDSGLVNFEQLKCAVAHTAFLCSAALVQCADRDNVLWGGSHSTTHLHKTDWIVKGLARWFEDEVYTEVNSYRWDVRLSYQSYPPVLAAGLAAYPSSSRPLTDPYKRALFWKVLSGRCDRWFSPKNVICASLADDPAGLAALQQALSDNWMCNAPSLFADEADFHVARMLLDYSAKTEGANSIATIDPNAPAFPFETPIHVLTPSAATAPGEYPPTSQATLTLPAASVATVKIADVTPLPAGASVTLTLTPSGDTVGAWAGPTPHILPQAGTELLSSTQSKTYTYGSSGSAPEQFVAVVNPSFTDSTSVGLLAALNEPNRLTLDWDFDDQNLRSCLLWHGHVDAVVSTSVPLAATLTRDADWPDQADLSFVGAAPTYPVTIDISGTLMITPANGGVSDSCPTGGGQTTVWRFSDPVLKYGKGGQAEMGAFTLQDLIPSPRWSECGDTAVISWHIQEQYYDSHGSPIGSPDSFDAIRGFLCVSWKLTQQ